jgi:hypothetical protein
MKSENSVKRENSAPLPMQREAGNGNFKVNDYCEEGQTWKT